MEERTSRRGPGAGRACEPKRTRRAKRDASPQLPASSNVVWGEREHTRVINGGRHRPRGREGDGRRGTELCGGGR